MMVRCQHSAAFGPLSGAQSIYSKGMFRSEKMNSHVASWCHVCAAGTEYIVRLHPRHLTLKLCVCDFSRHRRDLSKRHDTWRWDGMNRWTSLHTSWQMPSATAHRQLIVPLDVHLVHQQEGALPQHRGQQLKVAALPKRL